MSGYLRGLLVTVVICNLILYLVPDWNGDGCKKVIRYLCGIIVLLTMITPFFKSCNDNADGEIVDAVQDFFTPSSSLPDNQENAGTQVQSAMRETAYSVLTYLSSTYSIPKESISLTILTNSEKDGEEEEGIEITEIHLYIYNCSPSNREAIQRELSDIMKVPVFVFGRER